MRTPTATLFLVFLALVPISCHFRQNPAMCQPEPLTVRGGHLNLRLDMRSWGSLTTEQGLDPHEAFILHWVRNQAPELEWKYLHTAHDEVVDGQVVLVCALESALRTEANAPHGHSTPMQGRASLSLALSLDYQPRTKPEWTDVSDAPIEVTGGRVLAYLNAESPDSAPEGRVFLQSLERPLAQRMPSSGLQLSDETWRQFLENAEAESGPTLTYGGP